jgi:hypothetical protein
MIFHNRITVAQLAPRAKLRLSPRLLYTVQSSLTRLLR